MLHWMAVRSVSLYDRTDAGCGEEMRNVGVDTYVVRY